MADKDPKKRGRSKYSKVSEDKPVAKKIVVKEKKVTEAKAKTVKSVKIKAKKGLTTHKIQPMAEESKIEATKYYPAQMKDEEKKSKPEPVKEEYKPKPTEDQIQERYYDNKIILLVRDPYWCYAFWDISGELIAAKSKELKPEWGHAELTLRVYDITDIIFNGRNAHKFQDITITGGANNWYVNVWESGRTYIVDIGLKTSDGHFIMIARSNVVNTPRDKVSNVLDEEWMVVDEDFDEIFRMSGGGRPLGASEKGRLEFNLSSENVSSFSSPAYKPEGKGFFLIADTELILYGATEKNASLTIKNEPVKLSEDGTFNLRFHLPTGKIDLPVNATSQDKKDNITIKITVERKTE